MNDNSDNSRDELRIEISIADEYAAYINWQRKQEFERANDSEKNIDSESNRGEYTFQM